MQSKHLDMAIRVNLKHMIDDNIAGIAQFLQMRDCCAYQRL